MEEEKLYCVYGHFYNGVIFYIGSGTYYRNGILRSRAYNFRKGNRSENWFAFCEGNTDQVKVRIFLRTNNRQEAYDFEEELTRRYFDHKAPLANVNIGTHRSDEWIKEHLSGENNPLYGMKHSEETINKISEALSGENSPMWGKNHSAETINKMSLALKGKTLSEEHKKKISENSANAMKVLVINNEINEEETFDSITQVYEFISQHGFDKTKMTLHNYLKKGVYSFNEYTIELA